MEWMDRWLNNQPRPTPLPKQKAMQALDVEEMESSSKIDLDVSWWMSIKNAYKLGAPITTKLSKKGCIFLTMGRRLFQVAQKHD